MIGNNVWTENTKVKIKLDCVGHCIETVFRPVIHSDL